MGLIEDMVHEAEVKRAALEGREPDFDNPAGIAGVTLNPGESVVGEFINDEFVVVDTEAVEPDAETVFNEITQPGDVVVDVVTDDDGNL